MLQNATFRIFLLCAVNGDQFVIFNSPSTAGANFFYLFKIDTYLLKLVNFLHQAPFFLPPLAEFIPSSETGLYSF